MTAPPDLSLSDAARLRRRGVRLEYATIAWNLGEAFITIGLGIAAGSLALVAFGMDSIVEVFASSVVVWHDTHPEVTRKRTVRALRLIAVAFFLLAAFLTAGAIQRLATATAADESPWGIAYLAITVVVMFWLARLKHRTGTALGSEPLVAEARITYLDAALAFGILTALALNMVAGWWWADPVAALLVSAAAMSEGREAWSGELA